MSNLQTNRGMQTDVTQSRISSLANEVKVGHWEPPELRDENNRFTHWEPSKSHYDIITYMQGTALVFLYVISTTAINEMLKFHDNISPVQRMIATRVKHEWMHWKSHDDVIKWKHFPRYWPFVRGIHRPPVNSPREGQWRGALIFSLIYA